MLLLVAMRTAVLAFAVLGQSLLAYTLLPEGRGAYAVCVLVASVAGVVIAVGVDRGSQYLVMTEQASLSQTTAVSLMVCLVGSVAAAAVLIPMIHSELSFFDKASARSFYLALALSPLICISSTIKLQLAGFRRFVCLAILTSTQAAINSLMIAAMVEWLEFGVNGAIIALASGHMVVIFAGIAHFRRHHGLRLEVPRLHTFVGILGYGFREYLGQVIHTVDSRIGALLLGMIAGRSEIGLFAAGSVLMSRILVIPDAVSISILPRIAQQTAGQLEKTTFCARVCWWLTAAIFLVWVSVSRACTRILLSDSFLPVVPLTWIVGLGFVVYSGADIFATYFRGVNRPGICSWAMAFGLCANVISFFPLYAAFGLTGMAWAMTAGLICRSVYLVWMFGRVSGAPLGSVLFLQHGDVANMWDAVWSIAGRWRGIRNARP